MSSKNTTDTTISKSKQKRLAQENARKAQRKQKAMTRFWAIFIPLVIVLAIVALVMYYKSLQVDYEKYLADDGTIQGINANDYISGSYTDMNFDANEIIPEDYMIESDIESALDEHKTLNNAPDKQAQIGDDVNITYVATVNGEIIDQASVEQGGEDIVLGGYDIDEAIDNATIGHVAGDSYNVTVAYPEDHYDEELAGKNVLYDITLTGIYDIPVLSDEFIQTYYGDVASTVDEYKKHLKENYLNDNLQESIEDSISINCVVNQYPDDYLNNTMKSLKAQDKETLNYYKQMGLQLEGVKQLYGVETDAEYNAKVLDNAKNSVMRTLFSQKVMADNGLTNTQEEVKAYFLSHDYDDAAYEQALSRYGYKYMANVALNGRMIEFVRDQLKVNYPIPEGTTEVTEEPLEDIEVVE